MKKIIASALAATLLLSTAGAAMAQPYRGGDRGYSRDYRGNDYRNNYRNNYRNDYRGNDYRYRHRNNNAGAAIGLGIGILALGAIIASSQNRHYDRYDNGYYYGR